MEESTKDGEIPATNGTGAVRQSLKLDGRIGMRTCSHWKGYSKERKAYVAQPKIVLDWDTNSTFLSKSKDSKTLIIF